MKGQNKVQNTIPGVMGSLLITVLLTGSPADVLAKPKAPRLGMHECTVGERNGIDVQDSNANNDCIIAGGTMYCDNSGYSCCKTAPNGTETCVGQDWERPSPQHHPNPGTFRPPGTLPPKQQPGMSPPIMRRGVEGEQPTPSEQEGK